MRASARLTWGVEVSAAAAVAASYFLVWPVGEYAVLDDWTYMKSLAHLDHEGRLQILDFNPMSIVGLLFSAWPFIAVFGFSFTVAKLSVVLLHVAECVALVRLLRLCDVPPRVALAAVTTLTFNPLHFFHSFTFMTDVPAVAWQTIAVYAYARAMADEQATKWRWLAAGSLAGAMAFLIRQSGVVVPLAFLAYAILFHRSLLRLPSLAAALVPFVVAAGAFEYWYVFVRGPTSTFHASAARCLDFLLHAEPGRALFLLFAIAAYLGFFLWPLSLTVSLGQNRPGPRRRLAFATVGWGLLNLFAYYYLYDARLFPYFINVITRFGFFTTNDVIVGERDVVWGDGVQWLMNAGVMASLLAIVFRACSYAWAARQSPVADRVLRFLVLLLAVQVCYCIATAPILFDRHLLILAPTSIAAFCLLSRDNSGLRGALFVVALAPFVFYSIAGSHDVQAMSRTAFAAGNDLIDEGVDPKSIDGGYAFDGWFMYERPGRDTRPRSPSDPWWLRGLLHGIDEEYVVTSSTSYDARRYLAKAQVPPGPNLNDREAIKAYSYRSFWPWKVQHVYVMKRKGVSRKQ